MGIFDDVEDAWGKVTDAAEDAWNAVTDPVEDGWNDAKKEIGKFVLEQILGNAKAQAENGGQPTNTGPDGDEAEKTHPGNGEESLGKSRSMLLEDVNAVVMHGNAASYVVDHIRDTVIETPGGGTDTIESMLGEYRLPAHVANLTFIGPSAHTGHGNDLDNVMIGNRGVDTLFGNGGNDTLYGNGGADVLYGGAGNDTLDGGADADVMHGGSGNDVYIVDDANDVVSEAVRGGYGRHPHFVDAGGIDEVKTTLATYSLENNRYIENLTYTGDGAFTGTGNARDNVISGGAGDDRLFGLEGNDTLYGGGGNDRLDGGTGDDRMVGGGGNDVYFVDSVNDTVVEQSRRPDPHSHRMAWHDAGGTDEIRTTLNSYSLDNNPAISGRVENLSFDGTGNFTGQGNALNNVISGGQGDDKLSGGEGNDTLHGNLGNDLLDGGAGDDRMVGGAGDDVYIVDSINDTVVERSRRDGPHPDLQPEGGRDSGGTDEIRTSLSNYSLEDNATISGRVENLTFTGTGDFTGHGNALDNAITGGAGNDLLTGGIGADRLTGGAGADKFAFALGDNGVTAETADHILDFGLGDKLDVSSFVASHATIEATRNFHGDIAEALNFANAKLAIGQNAAGSAILADSSSHNVYVFLDQDGDRKFESAVILDNAEGQMDAIHTALGSHQLFV